MKKTLLFFAALLCTVSAWADAGFFSTGAAVVNLSVDGTAKTKTWNSTGVSAIDLGEIKSLSIVSFKVNTWKNSSGNICGGILQYRVYKTDATAGDWQEIDGKNWLGESTDNGSTNQTWGTNTDVNKDVTPAAPGNYKLEIQFYATGNTSSNDGCEETITMNNGGNYYIINFTIPTPTVPYVLFSEDVPTTVEAGTAVTLSAIGTNYSGEITYAYSVKVPDAEDFTAIEGNSYTPTAAGTYTIKVVATSGEESDEEEMTLTVKAAAKDITIRVQIPDGLTSWETTAPYLWNWNDDDGITGNFVAMTAEDDNWYSATVHAATINFIVVNGNSWSGNNARQTVDVIGVTASGCYVLGNATGKKTVTATACPTNEPSVVVTPSVTEAIVGTEVTFSATTKNFGNEEATFTYTLKKPNDTEAQTVTKLSFTPDVVGEYVITAKATSASYSANGTCTVTAKTKYYLAGTGIEGLGWKENEQMPMYDNMITFKNVAASTKVSFKVVGETWYGISNLDSDKSSKGIEGTDNIEFTTSTECDVTIQIDGTTNKITVTGEFGGEAVITSYTVAADSVLVGVNWSATATANDMVETAEGSNIWTLTKENVALEAKTYKYEIVANHSFDIQKNEGNLVIKAAGNYNVTFTLDLTGAEASVKAEAVAIISKYSVSGDAAIIGTNGDLTKGEGNDWTLTVTGLQIVNTGDYTYSVIGDGNKDLYSTTEQTLNIAKAGIYTIVYTFNSETKALTAAPTKTGDIPTEDVVFSVTVPEGTPACYIVTNLDEFATFNAMTKTDDTHYTITLNCNKSLIAYKYCCAESWDNVEVTAEGGEVANRSYAESDVVAAWKAVPATPVVYYIAGEGLDGITWDANSYELTDNTATFKDVAAETIIIFKITDGSCTNSWGSADIDADNSDADYEADGTNVKLVTKEVTDVTISFDPATKKITVKGSFGAKIEITSYTIVGDKALTGFDWNTDEESNNMTEGENGVWTLVKTDVSLTAGEYKYKVVGNHSYAVYQLPASGDQTLTISETGVYTVTFTLNVTAGTLNANAVKTSVTPTGIDNATAVSVYAENGTIYADGQMRIYTISGIDVTEQNGQLQGIYVVKCGGKITKVVVR